ncbi:MAG: hypothetical protein R2712_31695 [Vicinamibacterales bacterium]
MLATSLASAPAPSPKPQAAPAPVPAPVPAPAPRAPSRPAADAPKLPIEVEVVIARYRGETLISRLPYTLAVTANAGSVAQLNMGTDVPVPTTTTTPSPAPKDGADAPEPRTVQTTSYRSVGTAITCIATGGADGVFEVSLNVDDSSIFTSEQAAMPAPVPGTMPVFRSFRSRNVLLLKDGDRREYTAAADRVSGEVVRVDVRLRLVK